MIVRLVALLVLAGAAVGGVARLRPGGGEECPSGACAPMPQPAAATTLATLAAPPPPRAYDEEDVATWMHGATLGGVGPRHDPRSIWAALEVAWDDDLDLDEPASTEPRSAREDGGAGAECLGYGTAFVGGIDRLEDAAALVTVRILGQDDHPIEPGTSVRLDLVPLGAPLPGAARARKGALEASGTTTEGGVVVLAVGGDVLAPGPAVLSGLVDAPGPDSFTRRLTPAGFTLAPGACGPVTLRAEGRIDLEVLVLDHEGRPRPGVRVSLQDAHLAHAVPTDASGLARIEGVHPLNARAWIFARDDATDAAASVRADLDGESARRTLRLPPPPGRGEIELLIMDEAGAPLEFGGEGAVSCEGIGWSSPIVAPWSLSERPFPVRAVPAGEYWLSTSGADGLRATGLHFESELVRVRPGERAIARLVGRRPGTLRLRVVAEGARSRMAVAVHGEPGWEGTFAPGEVREIPTAGDVRVTVAPPGLGLGEPADPADDSFSGSGDALRLRIAPGETVERTVTIHRRGDLVLRAARPDGSPFQEGAPLLSSLATPPAFPPGEVVANTHDEASEARVTHVFYSVPAGPCLVRYLGAEVRAEIRPGARTLVDLVVAPTTWEQAGGEGESAPPLTPGALAVAVVDDEGRPAREAIVSVRPEGGVEGALEIEAQGGAAAFDLPPGAYVVTASGGGRGEGAPARAEVPEGGAACVTVRRGAPREEGREPEGDEDPAAEVARVRLRGPGLRSIQMSDPSDPTGERATWDSNGGSGDDIEVVGLRPGAWRIRGYFGEGDNNAVLARHDETRTLVAGEVVVLDLAARRGAGSVLVRFEVTGHERCELTGPGISWTPGLSGDRRGAALHADELPAGRYALVSSRGRLLRTFDLAEGAAVDLGTIRLGP